MNTSQRRSVQLTVDGKSLEGELTVPTRASDLVLVTTGTAGACHASLETTVANRLNRFGLATLVVDLLSAEESSDRQNRLDIDLLRHRLELQFDWVAKQVDISPLDTMLCGVGTGAAAALDYLLNVPRHIDAISLLNGRLDLVSGDFSAIDVPALFFVDDDSQHLFECNRAAYESAGTEPGRKHLLHAVNEDAVSFVPRWLFAQASADSWQPSTGTRPNSRPGV